MDYSALEPSRAVHADAAIVVRDLVKQYEDVLAVDGISFAAIRPLWGMLTIAFAVGLGLSTTLLEPATTAAAFDERLER